MSSRMKSSDNSGDGAGPMALVMTLVFKYLNVSELLIASKVCVAWNEITKDNYLWKTFSLKNCMVRDWEKCIDIICRRNSVVLDTRGMLKPVQPEKIERFWAEFASALQNAKSLKHIELYKCPVSLVESAIYSLPQLTVLNATSQKILSSFSIPQVSMKLNLNYLDQMVQLTELKLKGITGIYPLNYPSFENLVNLKTLALTSFRGFSNRDFNSSLESVTTNLEFLEIGEGASLDVEFAMTLKRFTNLTSLRLEKCNGTSWNDIAKKVFCSIAGLEKLRILELIDIDFTDNVEDELKKCNNIKALLVIPEYRQDDTTLINYRVLECLKILSKNLTHFIWGLTYESLRRTDKFCIEVLDNYEHLNDGGRLNNICVRSSLQSTSDAYILSIPALKDRLQTMMEHAKIEIVKVTFEAINHVYLIEHFNDV